VAWRRLGLIFGPSGQGGWMMSHAQVPTVLVKADRLRVYITVRPQQTTSLTTFVDLDITDPRRVLYVHEEPILPLGKPGTFDEFGVMPSCVVEVDGLVHLYTTGWSRGQTVPYLNAVGLAVSEDGGKTFRRPYDGPVVDRTAQEPYSAMSPYILRRDGLWHMWYSSGVDWVRPAGKYEPIYLIKYAHSTDGIAWERPNLLCIPGKSPGEANTRPSVLWEDGLFRMWFCYRGSEAFRGGGGSYRIGYAESADGKLWRRDDQQAVLDPASAGWDSDTVAYPQVVDTPSGRLMFYNGNGFGTDGFGCAVWANG
jgi:predicted GH43/DUF377 family glycosyl hydrolase